MKSRLISLILLVSSYMNFNSIMNLFALPLFFILRFNYTLHKLQ